MEQLKETSVIIMAAGRGTRLGNVVPKPLSIIANKESILSRIVGTVLITKPARLIIVVGHKAKEVTNHLSCHYKYAGNINFILQERLDGTLGAVEVGMSLVPDELSPVLILPADNGWFLKAKTLQSLVRNHLVNYATISILLSGEFNKELHKVRYRVSEGKVREVQLIGNGNDSSQTYLAGTGVICLEKKYFNKNKHLIKPLLNGEYTISRIIEIALAQGETVGYVIADKDEVITINTKEDLERLRSLVKS